MEPQEGDVDAQRLTVRTDDSSNLFFRPINNYITYMLVSLISQLQSLRVAISFTFNNAKQEKENGFRSFLSEN